MLKDDSLVKDAKIHSPQLSSNPFAEAILSFIDELRDNEDRKSIFYKEVIQVACRFYLTDDPARQTIEKLSTYLTDLELQPRKKNGIRRVPSSEQLVEGLLQYTSALDVMTQADPAVSALLYGGAKLIFQLANGYTKYFEQIVQMMADVGVQLQYFHIYSQGFAQEKSMNGILFNSYRDIILFLRDASKILNQRGKRFLGSGLLTPLNERYAKFKQKLDKNAQNIRHMAQALQVRQQANFSRDQEAQVRELGLALDNSSTRSVSPRPPSYDGPAPVSRHDEVRRWIAGSRASKIDPQFDLNRHLSARHVGTSEWIFEDPVFVKWQSSKESTTVWMNAAPGAGKSVLSASVVEHFMQSEQKDQTNVIYFFCRFDEPDKCKAISALKSLAIQALKFIKYVPDDLYQLYQDDFASEDSFVVNIELAERVLGYLLKRIEYISIVVDGLDECHESILLDSLLRLRDQKTYGITKWFFTSRNEGLLRKRFENSKSAILSVPSNVVQTDIRKFLKDRSSELCGTDEQLERLTELSEGNFLMMRLTVDPFRNEEFTCSEEFEEALDDFQPELGQCWFRSLQRLSQRSEQYQELAQMIFTSVILAIQPLTFNELTELLSIKIGSEPSESRRRTRAVILSACSPFIEADYEADFANPTIRLVHKSIGDFLTQDPTKMEFVTESCYRFFIKYREGHTEIGRRCLTYLNYEVYEDFDVAELDDDDTVDHGFLKYASIFWHHHVQEAGESEYFYDEIRELLRSPNMWTCVRVQSKFAPHMFAKLVAFKDKEDSYDMSIPNNTPGLPSTVEEFYAHALPQWLNTYDDQGHHLNWGYHMFVRDWGEVLLRYPDKIQTYFAKVLGSKSFWYIEDQPDNVKVKCCDKSFGFEDLSKMYSTGNVPSPRWHTQTRKNEFPHEESTEVSYIKNTLKEYRGDWEFQHCAIVSQQTASATIYRYQQKPKTSKADDDSDSESELETSEDEVITAPLASDPAIWFMSVATSPGDVHWFHHKSKAAILQKSAPIFVPDSQWLLWPQDESTLFFLNTKTLKTSTFNLPSKAMPDLMMISQDYHFSTYSNELYSASVYGSTTKGFVIKYTKLPFLPFGSPTEVPTLDTSAIASIETTWRYANTSFSLPTSFFWAESTLYAALGSPAVKLFRFPSPPKSTAAPATQAIQILKRKLFIPSSSYARGLQFLVKSNDDGSSQAIFALDAAPTAELPAVVLDFKLGKDDWKTYNPKEKDEDSVATNTLGFLKGTYAAKEQAFRVPIRSGLDWRRSVYVTCW
ncbi:hypothetical protein ONS95_001233 [Cadophora gregata]|uniref:uncharacterized protein n=1 Tax=Cadophora gregata TaxID=51156 RepID=UPI0026DB45B5|nr:uncharacterized protein ONS95_001233 [Cadophora gregata]KAK0101958.1 hypothetical protein ONS96_005928 [Cadophora gregata f. sp. sojae]KAK0129300.1 hypothetical protein ONS95_001233 [Cadophora gregata]